MLRTILFGLLFWVEMFLSVILYLLSLLIELFSKQAHKVYVRKVTRGWSLHALSLAGIKVMVEGKENIPETDKVCIVSNHQSYLDIPVLIIAVPKLLGFIAKAELGKVPFLNFWLKALKSSLVSRKKFSQAIKSTQQRFEFAEKGYPVVIFPEGSRAKDGQIRRFKTGGIRVLNETELVILPVTINGSFKILEYSGKLRKGTVYVTIHPPVFPESRINIDYRELTGSLKEIIQSGL